MAGSSLRSFIKDVRSAKTVAEERAIITKASAKIRTKLRDDHLPQEKRRNNIQKLLYLYVLGEKTHFGQVECINLIASDDFADKRLGYLAATLLLDGTQDLLTLLTNLLNNDLSHPNRYVVSLALTTLGFLSSSELARDLYPDVENILNRSKDPFLVKKALQCVAKLILKDATLLEVFQPQYLVSLLQNRSICTHGVLLSITKVLQSILSSYPQYQNSIKQEDSTADVSGIVTELVPMMPELLTILQNLNTKNFEPEFDIQGTSDPFLQCELLCTLRMFFQVCTSISVSRIDQYVNKFGDLLTQIATNTDGSKNCGQAILYETVRTIFSLNMEQPLRVLGINILGKFLSGKDNNSKYVGLNTLLHVVPQEPAAVQRHRKFISRCLRDPDTSIRKRALELSFAILDEANIKELVEELIEFLKKASEDDKSLIVYTVENLVTAFNVNQSVDQNWKLETLVTVLKLVGPFITAEPVSEILISINNATDSRHRNEVVRDMLKISLDKSRQDEVTEDNVGWRIATIWCIGEYGGAVLQGGQDKVVSESSLSEYLVQQQKLCDKSENKILHYILTATLKLSTHINDPGCIEALRQIVVSHTKDADLMIQTKSVQYEVIFRQPSSVKKVICEAMPKFEKKVEPEVPKNLVTLSRTKSAQQEPPDVLDLLGDDAGTSSGPAKSADSQPQSSPADLLADIFGTDGNGISDATSNKINAPQTLQIPPESVKVHESASVDCFVRLVSCSMGIAQLELYLKSKESIQNFQTFCAVPKTQKLTLSQIHPSNSLEAGQVARQNLKITGSGKLKLRIKLDFMRHGTNDNQQFDHKFDQIL